MASHSETNKRAWASSSGRGKPYSLEAINARFETAERAKPWWYKRGIQGE